MSDITLKNTEIVTLAVAQLGGDSQAIDIEDIAIRAYELAPDRFSWRKYPKRIDLRAVQYALKNALGSKDDESLLTGSIRRGYMVTSIGLDWIESSREHIESTIPTLDQHDSGGRLQLEEARLLSSTAYRKSVANRREEITYADFQEFARVNDYFPDHVREKRFITVANAAREDGKLNELWDFLRARFVDNDDKKERK